MVRVYVPATKLLAVAFVPPLGDQAYEYPGVPPETRTEALPVFPPLHETGVLFTILAAIVIGSEIFACATVVQPLISVMVIVCKPALSVLAVCPLAPDGLQA